MTDIVERLREYWEGRYRDEAADNERLRADNARLRAALREIADAYAAPEDDENAVWMRDTARAALDGKDE